MTIKIQEHKDHSTVRPCYWFNAWIEIPLAPGEMILAQPKKSKQGGYRADKNVHINNAFSKEDAIQKCIEQARLEGVDPEQHTIHVQRHVYYVDKDNDGGYSW